MDFGTNTGTAYTHQQASYYRTDTISEAVFLRQSSFDLVPCFSIVRTTWHSLQFKTALAENSTHKTTRCSYG